MDNFGIAISQDGAPVDKAADTQKVLDSRWEYMNIHVEDTVDVHHDFINAEVIAIPLVSHDLAFLPAFSVQIDSHINADNSDLLVSFVASTRTTYVVLSYLKILTTSLSVDMTVTVRIFDCDITRYYKAPVREAVPGVASNKSSFGARALSDNGISIASHNLEDFTLNTDAKAICIQEHGIITPSGGVITIEHDFGAPPSFAIARYYSSGITISGVNPLGVEPLIATINSTEGLGTVNKKTLVLSGAQSSLPDTSPYAYILFKDPLETNL